MASSTSYSVTSTKLLEGVPNYDVLYNIHISMRLILISVTSDVGIILPNEINWKKSRVYSIRSINSVPQQEDKRACFHKSNVLCSYEYNFFLSWPLVAINN